MSAEPPFMAPGLYLPKTVPVRAMRVSGNPDNLDALAAWIGPDWRGFDLKSKPTRVIVTFAVTKNNGQAASVGIGDWIIAESDGIGFYPCTREAFQAKYVATDPVVAALSGRVSDLPRPDRA